jgi:hypothetical protein
MEGAERNCIMSTRFAPLLRSAALAGLLALAACGQQDANIAALDNELMANGADPALTSALEDQILVDPNLVQQAHPNSVRPPETPVQAQYPAGPDPTRPELRRAAGGASGGGCTDRLVIGPQWATRLPPQFPMLPGGRVTEAAGTDDGGCHMRVVTFTSGERFERVLDFYRAAANRAGFSAEHQVRGADHVLGGTNSGSDGAFYLIVTPTGGGSEVALIVNNG